MVASIKLAEENRRQWKNFQIIIVSHGQRLMIKDLCMVGITALRFQDWLRYSLGANSQLSADWSCWNKRGKLKMIKPNKPEFIGTINGRNYDAVLNMARTLIHMRVDLMASLTYTRSWTRLPALRPKQSLKKPRRATWKLKKFFVVCIYRFNKVN